MITDHEQKEFGDVEEAIKREKQLKKYRREWKENLIGEMNPEWERHE